MTAGTDPGRGGDDIVHLFQAASRYQFHQEDMQRGISNAPNKTQIACYAEVAGWFATD